MTGYGKAECLLPTRKLTIEIKSLNSKQVDTSTRLPGIYKEKELEIRQLLSKQLQRGKVECSIHYELIEGASSSINQTVVRDYMDQLKELSSEYNLSDNELLASVLRFPDTVTSQRESLEDSEWEQVINGIQEALKELDSFRLQEGKALERDLESCIEAIREKQAAIAPFEEERITRLRERITTNLEELSNKEDFDQNRLEQELIYYMEKLDINEEKVRLENHLNYFTEILKAGSPNGKKLGFISQEIGREVNTLGSKANHSEIQRIVVSMKDDLEKIKEQLLNVL